MQLPDGIPPWVAEVVVGHLPEAVPEQIRRSADHLSSAANALDALADRLEERARTDVELAIDGAAGAAIRKQLDTIVTDKRAIAKGLNDLARKTYEFATTVEFQLYLAIGIIAALMLQLAVSGALFFAGGSVIAIAQRLAAKEAVMLGWRQMLARLAQILATSVVRFPRASMVLGATVLGMTIGGGVNWGAQQVQVAQGHREKVNWKEVGVAVAAGAVGGIAGVYAGRLAASAVGRYAVDSASRAARMRQQVLATLAAGVAGGGAGGLAGGITAFVVTGGDLRKRDLINMIITGAGSGLVGSVGSSVNSARAAAGSAARVPSPTAEGPVPDIASAPGDGHVAPPESITRGSTGQDGAVTGRLAGEITKIGENAAGRFEPGEFAPGPSREAYYAYVAEQNGAPRRAGPEVNNPGGATKDAGSQSVSPTGNRGPGTPAAPMPGQGHPGPAGAAAAPEARPIRVTASVSATPDGPAPPVVPERSVTTSHPATGAPEGIGGDPGPRVTASVAEAPATTAHDPATAGPAADHTAAGPNPAGDGVVATDGNPPGNGRGDTPGITDGDPPPTGDGAYHPGTVHYDPKSGEMYCAPEVAARSQEWAEQRGAQWYGRADAIGDGAAIEGVDAASFAKALGGDFKPGGWRSPEELIDDIAVNGGHAAAVFQFDWGAHAATVTHTKPGHVMVAERLMVTRPGPGGLPERFPIIREVHSEGIVREYRVDPAGSRVKIRDETVPGALHQWLTQLPETRITNAVQFGDNGLPLIRIDASGPGGPDGLKAGIDVPWDKIGHLHENGTALLDREAAPPPTPERVSLAPADEAAFADIARNFDLPAEPVADPGPAGYAQQGDRTAAALPAPTVEPGLLAGMRPATAEIGPVPAVSPEPAPRADPTIRTAMVPETGLATSPPKPEANPAAGSTVPEPRGPVAPATAEAGPAPGRPHTAAPPATAGIPAAAAHAAPADDPTPWAAVTPVQELPPTENPVMAVRSDDRPEALPAEPEEFHPRNPGPLVDLPRIGLVPNPGAHGTTYPLDLPPQHERPDGTYFAIPGIAPVEEDGSKRDSVLPREIADPRPNLPAERPRFLQPQHPDRDPDANPEAETPATPWVTPPQHFTAAPPHLPADTSTGLTDPTLLPSGYSTRPDEYTPGAPTDPSRAPGHNPHGLDEFRPPGDIPDHAGVPTLTPARPPGKPVEAFRPIPWARVVPEDGTRAGRRRAQDLPESTAANTPRPIAQAPTPWSKPQQDLPPTPLSVPGRRRAGAPGLPAVHAGDPIPAALWLEDKPLDSWESLKQEKYRTVRELGIVRRDGGGATRGDTPPEEEPSAATELKLRSNGAVIGNIASLGFGSAYSLVAFRHGASASDVAGVLAAGQAVTVLSQAAAGKLSDAYDSRAILRYNAAGTAAVMTTSGIWILADQPGFMVALSGAYLVGMASDAIAQNANFVYAPRLAKTEADQALAKRLVLRDRAMSAGLGKGVGPLTLLVGPWAPAALNALAQATNTLILGKLPPGEPEAKDKVKYTDALKVLWADKWMRNFTIMNIPAVLTTAAGTFILSVRIEELDFNGGIAAVLMSSVAGGILLTRAVLPEKFERVNLKWTYPVSFVGLSASMAVLATADSWPVLAGAYALSGVAAHFNNLAFGIHWGKVFPEKFNGSLTAVTNIAGSLGGAAGPIVAATGMAIAGPEGAAMGAAAAFGALVIGATISGLRTLRHAKEAPPEGDGSARHPGSVTTPDPDIVVKNTAIQLDRVFREFDASGAFTPRGRNHRARAYAQRPRAESAAGGDTSTAAPRRRRFSKIPRFRSAAHNEPLPANTGAPIEGNSKPLEAVLGSQLRPHAVDNLGAVVDIVRTPGNGVDVALIVAQKDTEYLGRIITNVDDTLRVFEIDIENPGNAVPRLLDTGGENGEAVLQFGDQNVDKASIAYFSHNRSTPSTGAPGNRSRARTLRPPESRPPEL
ncbi:hypothetical protein [Nocardia sp. NPDC024068]|uniref:WXG100-like domain-containing protein n=1 Tax=Nocardia sp. NPDC024068 TaxID=3157197 RepID=UPI0033ED8813